MSELIKSLVAARKLIGAAKKGAVNPHYRSKYADLGSVIEAVKEPLESCGLTFVQTIKENCVVTVILHEAGETLDLAPFPIVAAKQDAQGFGSALTYARRYSLQTALGVPSEDDDGNAASKKTTEAAIISPVKESLKGVTVDKSKVEAIAGALIDFHAEDDEKARYGALELLDGMDSDLKLAVWDALQGYSKVRSWAKAIKAQA